MELHVILGSPYLTIVNQFFVVTLKAFLQTFSCLNSCLKAILVRVLFWLPYKPEFWEYFDNSLKESNTSYIQECLSDFDVNLFSRNKIVLKSSMDLCLNHFLRQLIMEPTTTKHTKMLIDHILTNSQKRQFRVTLLKWDYLPMSLVKLCHISN